MPTPTPALIGQSYERRRGVAVCIQCGYPIDHLGCLYTCLLDRPLYEREKDTYLIQEWLTVETLVSVTKHHRSDSDDNLIPVTTP